MKLRAASQLLHYRPKRITTIVMMLIIWSGIAGSILTGINIDVRTRDHYKSQAQILASTIALDDLRSLHGSQDDLATLSYSRLKNELSQIREVSNDIKHVYFIAEKDGKAVFMVDSEFQDNPYHYSPGTPYPEASSVLKGALKASSKPFIEGPVRERGGTWISARAPVLDPKTGLVLGVVGFDVPAASHYFGVFVYAIAPLLLAAIPLAGLLRDIKLESKEREIIHLKNQFVSIASHELRSPLNGLLWAIQSLIKDPPNDASEEQKELFHDMYRSAESSLATVNEILDFSVFDRGKEGKLQRDQVDIIKVLREVQKTLKLGAAEKGIIVSLAADWPDEVNVIGDLATLKRSFVNIISNAIKYSPMDGVILVTYEENENEHIIAIKDEGIGIPKEELDKVLQGYYRATNATKMQSNGTGLGLWLSRLIVEQHGGRLWLESQVRKGTTAFMALPKMNKSELQKALDEKPKEDSKDHNPSV